MIILFTDTAKLLLALFLLVILFFALHIKINRKDEITIIERLGKFNRLIDEPSIYFIFPFIDRVLERISLNDIVEGRRFTLNEADTPTKIELTIRYKVFDAKLYAYASIDPVGSIIELIKTAKENHINDTDMDEQVKSYGRDLGMTILSYHLINHK